MSKVDVQMVNTEVTGLKDNMWKLTGRIQLMEKFIQKQFGDVFWEFVQEHAESESEYIPRSPTPPIAPSVTVTLIQPSSSSTSSNSESSSSNNSSSSNGNNTSSGAPPPPPPLIPASSLAAFTGAINSQGGNRVGPRNFLPKSLASNTKAKPVLRAASLTAGDSPQNHQGARKNSLSPTNSVNTVIEDKKSIIKQVRAAGVGESILKSSLKAIPSASTHINTGKMRPTGSTTGSTPPTKRLVMKRVVPIDYLKVEEEDEYEPDEKRMNMNSSDSDMITYAQPNRSVKILRTPAGIKAETDGYSAAHNGFLREMRPNPCHTRCQNRCHDIWTDQDRMDVFQSYWSIPTEDERRQWVAERIERVDMATKKTEYSNFRTCTFKYYFPHPENPRVQVCKNFFLATIDEKRSYVEKIAQEVKGYSEHYSIQDIPFRRKNQMKGSNGNGGSGYKQYDSYEIVGWMTGLMDGQDQNDEYEENGDEDGEEGMEMEEMIS